MVLYYHNLLLVLYCVLSTLSLERENETNAFLLVFTLSLLESLAVRCIEISKPIISNGMVRPEMDT